MSLFNTTISRNQFTILLCHALQSNIFASGGLGGEVFIWDLEASLNPISKSNDANADDSSASTNGLGSMPITSLRPINSSNNVSVHATQSQGYVPIAAKGHKESVYALATNDRGTLLVSGGTEKVSSGCLSNVLIKLYSHCPVQASPFPF